MTSLKAQYANEIAEAMAKTLGDEEFLGIFKKASFEKEAAGPALQAFTNAVNAVKGDAAKIDALWNQHLPALQKEENEMPGTLEAAARAREAAKGGPGTTIPPAAEDEECMAKDESEEESETETCPVCGKQRLAADFALGHLVKIADALDNNGFSSLANIVDEAMTKIAKKKKKEEEEEKESKKSKKEEKEEKESKKSKKEEEEKKKVSEAAKKKTEYKTHKGKEEKAPKGAEHKAPKEWFDKMKADVKKKNPDYSAKRVSEIVGDIWDNELSDKKREQIYKRYGKKKSPNK